MRATRISSLAKRITIPRLSPTHTSARITQLLIPKSQTSVQCYDPIMILECSSDLIADPADRDYPEQKLKMIIETCDDGVVMDFNDHDGKWLEVGTTLAKIVEIDDDDNDVPADGDWLWEGFKHVEKKS